MIGASAYLWLVANGRMVVIVVTILPHSLLTKGKSVGLVGLHGFALWVWRQKRDMSLNPNPKPKILTPNLKTNP